MLARKAEIPIVSRVNQMNSFISRASNCFRFRTPRTKKLFSGDAMIRAMVAVIKPMKAEMMMRDLGPVGNREFRQNRIQKTNNPEAGRTALTSKRGFGRETYSLNRKMNSEMHDEKSKKEMR